MLFELLIIVGIIGAIGAVLWSLSSPGDCSEIPPVDLALDDPNYVSDDEFLAAMPGVDADIAFRTRRIISMISQVPEHAIHPRHRLVEDLGMD